MLSSSDCESRTRGRPAGARARRARAAAGYAPRLHRSAGLARSCARRSRPGTSAPAPRTCSRWPRPRRGSSSSTTRCSNPATTLIVEAPCYGSAIEVARSTGASVSLWRRRYEDGWAHDLEAARTAARPTTRLIYINSPHNPTGMQMTRATLRARARARRRALGDRAQRRGLPRARARRRRQAAGGVRPLRAGASRWARSPRRTACRGCASAGSPCREPRAAASASRELKLYTTICSQRAERTARGAGAAPRRRPDRAQAASSARATCRCSTRSSRAAREHVRVAAPERRADRLPARARRVRRAALVRADRRARPACCCCRARSTSEPAHVRFGFGRANLPRGARAPRRATSAEPR